MSTFGDGLDKAVQKAFTRPTPKSAGAQMRYLVKQYKGTRAVAQMLRISQRTVERYVKDQIKSPAPTLPRGWRPRSRSGGSRRSGRRPGRRPRAPAASSSTPGPGSATSRRSGRQMRTASGT